MYLTDTGAASTAMPARWAPAPPPSTTARLLSASLTTAWQRRLIDAPVFDARRLIEAAITHERSDDFGEDHWRPSFERLTQALVDEADLNPIGQTLAYGQLTKALRERLRAHALWRRHPEILDIPITAPIVIVGSMRSGTTRIQRLLACDDRFAHTRLYESLSPVPPRGLDTRVSSAASGLAFLHALNPTLAAIHPTGARQPDEEFGLFSFAFHGAQLEAQWGMPGFARWSERQDMRAIYREFRMLLQTIAWARGERNPRPWVLKAPQFMDDLDALTATFPDARLIFLHRDAPAVVASSASLAWQQLRVQSDSIDPRWVGAEWLHKTAHRVGRVAVARTTARQAMIDVDFADVGRDWRREVARIYTLLGMRPTERVHKRMERYLGSARKHRGHRYTLDQFGLTRDLVERVLPGGA